MWLPSLIKQSKSMQLKHLTERRKSPASLSKSVNKSATMLEKNLNDAIMLFGKKIVVSGNEDHPQKEISKAPLVDEKGKLKKPDKILPCPRCNSMDTKFCYYNNYNANQPRHFCKACQRYWTAGGSMRSVPVGAGRRKNKNSPSYYRHVSHPDASKRVDKVLSFSSDDCSSSVTISEEGRSKHSQQHFTAPYFAGFSWPYPTPFCVERNKEEDCGCKSRTDEMNRAETGLVLRANPAALSRSINFRESA